MSEHHKPRTVTPERTAEPFDTNGKTFEDALRLVLAGGRNDGLENKPDERGADI